MWCDFYFGLMPLPGGMSKSKIAKYKNNLEFQNWFSYLYNLAWGRFGYRNLDPTLNARNIERSMINNGRAGIARPDKDILMANGDTIPAGTPISPAFAAGYDINIYGEPLRGWGYGMDGFNHQFSLYVPGSTDDLILANAASGYPATPPEAVIGYNNDARYPTLPYIWTAAQRLADIWRAADVAIQNLKSPMIVRADETQKRSVEDMIRARTNNEISVVYLPNTIEKDNFQIFPFQMDHEVLREFREQAEQVIAKFLEKIGYNSNPQYDKRERSLVDEVNANNDVVIAALLDHYHERKLWIDRCNKLWGTDYEVYIKGIAPAGLTDQEGEDDGEGLIFEVEGGKPSETYDAGGMAGGQPRGGLVPGQRTGADDATGDQ